MCKRRLNIIAWLVACSFSWCWHSTLSADFYIRSEKLRSTGRDGTGAGSRDRQVPEFMMKLYKSVETGNSQLPIGNTVRSMAGQFSTFINIFFVNSVLIGLTTANQPRGVRLTPTSRVIDDENVREKYQ